MQRMPLLSILSGLLIGTSYIPFPPWALLFCLVPYFLFTIRATQLKQVIWGAWITQFILNLIGFHWIAYTAVEFGHLPWPVGILVLILFCSLAHLYFVAAAAVWFLLQQKIKMGHANSLLVLALSLALFEWMFPVMFPWNFGYPWLWGGLPIAQLAEWIGFAGLSALTILMNAALTWIFFAGNRGQWRRSLAAFAVIFLLLNAVGWMLKENSPTTDRQLRVLAVQGNIGNFEKVMAEKGAGFVDEILQTYISLSSEGLTSFGEKPDFMIWPETAYPDYLDQDLLLRAPARKLFGFLDQAQVPLMTGGYSRDVTTRNIFNAFFLRHPPSAEMSLTDRYPPAYRKTILLAFGEYFPGAQFIPMWLRQRLPEIGDFGRGSGPTIFQSGAWRFGPQICYEGLYPWFSRALAEQGAEFFVNVTNDSWFGRPFEPYQHLYMTAARAIEFRRPIIRSTNTGITTAINARGEVLTSSPLHQPWAGVLTVPVHASPPKTIYMSIEPLWTGVLILANLLALAWAFWMRRKANG